MSKIEFTGGNEADRQAIAGKHAAYLAANAVMDWDRLEAQVFSDAADGTFFNLNGHTYNGRARWDQLWKYYKTQMASGDWIPFDERGVISGDLALWCHRKTKIKWIGTDPRPSDNRHEDKEFISRSTMVYRREQGDWRVVHVHFSPGSDDARPGGV